MGNTTSNETKEDVKNELNLNNNNNNNNNNNEKLNQERINSTSTVVNHSITKQSEPLEVDLNYWYIIRHGYTELVHLIIRPPRAMYDMIELGPKTFQYQNKRYERKDFELINDRNLLLECSHWSPIEEDRPSIQMPCIIYMHGNSSCRVESLPILRVAFHLNATVFAFDFSGCGHSTGEYISLGYFERDDLQTVTDYLRGTGRVSMICLWGRSMGAATALLHGDRDPSIAAMILDSSFSDLKQLSQEVVENGRKEGYSIPSFIVKIVLNMIRSSIKKKANFDIDHLVPSEHAPLSFIPAIFISAKNDEFIRPHHSKEIYNKYAGEKNIISIDGDHNSPRPEFLYHSVSIFLQRALHIDTSFISTSSEPLYLPPWNHTSRYNKTEEYLIQTALRESLNDIKSLMEPEKQEEKDTILIPTNITLNISKNDKQSNNIN